MFRTVCTIADTMFENSNYKIRYLLSSKNRISCSAYMIINKYIYVIFYNHIIIDIYVLKIFNNIQKHDILIN